MRPPRQRRSRTRNRNSTAAARSGRIVEQRRTGRTGCRNSLTGTTTHPQPPPGGRTCLCRRCCLPFGAQAGDLQGAWLVCRPGGGCCRNRWRGRRARSGPACGCRRPAAMRTIRPTWRAFSIAKPDCWQCLPCRQPSDPPDVVRGQPVSGSPSTAIVGPASRAGIGRTNRGRVPTMRMVLTGLPRPGLSPAMPMAEPAGPMARPGRGRTPPRTPYPEGTTLSASASRKRIRRRVNENTSAPAA